MFAILLINASFLYLIESQPENRILDYCYFMIITLATVGFGDIVAKTVLGRVIKKNYIKIK